MQRNISWKFEICLKNKGDRFFIIFQLSKKIDPKNLQFVHLYWKLIPKKNLISNLLVLDSIKTGLLFVLEPFIEKLKFFKVLDLPPFSYVLNKLSTLN